MMQADFAAALMNPDQACPQGLYAWNGSDPQRRFAVYRNNVMVSLTDALASTFEVCHALVGDEFFKDMARHFLRQQTERPKVLTWLGLPFPSFIAQYPAAASVPYLADVAGLEMARVCSTHAADHQALPNTAWADLMAQPEQLANTCFQLAPCVALLHSKWAIVSIWMAHQVSDTAEVSLHDIALDQAESALVFRQGEGIRLVQLDAAGYRFLHTLQQGHSLAQAAQEASALSPTFALASALSVLIRHELVVALVP